MAVALPASLVPWSRLNRRFMTIGLSDALAYRGTFILGIVFSLIPLATSLLLWLAIYRAGATGMSIAGFDLHGMLSYYLVMHLLGLAYVVEDVQWETTQQIRGGTLNSYLMRPLSYCLVQWDLKMAAVLVAAAIALIPAALVAAAAWSILVVPAEAWQWPAFAVAVLVGIQIAFILSLCIGLSAFWFLETSGFLMAAFPMQMVLSGSLFPLELLPKPVYAVVGNLPWTYMTYFPLQIWLGRLDAAAVTRGLLLQAGWLAALMGFAAWLWSRGIKRYEAVGG